MKQIHFYATREDLLPVLEEVESQLSLKYVPTGRSASPKLSFFTSGASIPDLGKASHQSAAICDSFLVAEHLISIASRFEERPDGFKPYFVDQRGNPDTIVFAPGGCWDDTTLLYGWVATISSTVAAQKLMKCFERSITNRFRAVKSFRVGTSAFKWLLAGKRLAIGADSPVDFDLRFD